MHFQAVWNVVKQISTSQVAGSANEFFNQTYTILCGLADFFSGPDNHNLFLQAEFWEIIQQGLVVNEPLTRKRSMYLLKRALDLLDKQPCDLLVLSEKGSHIFYWSCDKKDSLMNIWHDYVLLMETLDEKQVQFLQCFAVPLPLRRILISLTPFQHFFDYFLIIHVICQFPCSLLK